MSKKKVAILIGIVLALCLAGGVGYGFVSGSFGTAFGKGANSQDKVYVEQVRDVMHQSTGVPNRYNGVVESQSTYEVNIDSSRTLKKVMVEEGDSVEVGTVLATYETSDIEMQIKLAELDLESTQTDIDGYNKQIEALNAQIAATTDEEKKFSYTTEIQSLQNSIAQCELDKESKKLEIQKYRDKLKDSSIVSKYDGVVKEINENSMDINGNSAPFMKIMQSGEYRVKGKVDEQNVWMITEGQPVIIRSRVDETQTWSGRLMELNTDQTETNENNNYYYGADEMQSATKYPFYVELDSAEGLLLGQHVYIEMDEGQEIEKEGIWLYESYIVQDENGAYVWAATKNNVLEKREVTLGEYDEELMEYEIVSGLTEDDYITWPMEGLYEGITTVTDMEEVDYTSPLYQQENTEMLYEMEDTDAFYEMEGTEAFYDSMENEYVEETEEVME